MTTPETGLNKPSMKVSSTELNADMAIRRFLDRAQAIIAISGEGARESRREQADEISSLPSTDESIEGYFRDASYRTGVELPGIKYF